MDRAAELQRDLEAVRHRPSTAFSLLFFDFALSFHCFLGLFAVFSPPVGAAGDRVEHNRRRWDPAHPHPPHGAFWTRPGANSKGSALTDEGSGWQWELTASETRLGAALEKEVVQVTRS